MLQARPDFGEIESFETLFRNWHVKGMSVRPVHRMVAHSAFIIVARRLASSAAAHAAPPLSPENDADGTTDDDYDGDDNGLR
jgi:tRNA (adenine57-N1/adenine58-N1)-methyltransferase